MGQAIYTKAEREKMESHALQKHGPAIHEIATVRAACSALREAEHQLEKYERKSDDARKLRDRRRLELGRSSKRGSVPVSEHAR